MSLTRNRLRFHRASSDRNHYTIIVRQLNLDLIGESNSPCCKVDLGERTFPAASILGTIITPQQRHLENAQREVEQDDAALSLFLSLPPSLSTQSWCWNLVLISPRARLAIQLQISTGNFLGLHLLARKQVLQ